MGPLSDDVDWDEVERQATDILSRYIQFDTTNPPGNEAEAARFLAQTLSDEGIESQLYEPTPGRANLVARLSASKPVAPPLLLMHHMDVVPADGTTWTRPPFHGLIRDGEIWGSQARLQGIIFFPIDAYFDLGETGAVHEVGHRWINFLDLPSLPETSSSSVTSSM